MKAHDLGRQLLAGPNLLIFHFDPSRAGLDDENDTSLSIPKVERITLDAEDIAAGRERADDLGRELLTDWLTISGEIDEDGEAFRPANWEPIDTAPRGELVLLWVSNAFGHGHVKTGIAYPKAYPDLSIVSVFDDGNALGYKPEEHATHWMPLPSHP